MLLVLLGMEWKMELVIGLEEIHGVVFIKLFKLLLRYLLGILWIL